MSRRQARWMPWERLGGYQHAQCTHSQTTGNQSPQADTVQPQASQDGTGQCADEQHRGQQSALQRRVARHPLKALRDTQQHAAGGERHRHGAQHTRSKGRVAKQRKVQQGMGQSALSPDEGQSCHKAGGQGRAQQAQVNGRMGGRLDGQHQRGERKQRQHRRGQIPGIGVRVALFGRHEPGAQPGHGDDGHVDEKERAPVEVAQQPAAQQRPQNGAHQRQAGPDRDGQRPFALVGKAHPDEGQRGRQHGRGTHGLQHAGQHQNGHRARIGCHQRGQPEDDQPRQVHAPVADTVAQRTRTQQQPGAEKRIGVDDPQPFGRAGVQFVREHRQGRQQDGDVHRDQQQAQAHHHQQQPAVGRFRRSGKGMFLGHRRCLCRLTVPSVSPARPVEDGWPTGSRAGTGTSG